MLFNDFMNESFPNLELKLPLFYNWDIGIRFELGVDYDTDYCYENGSYLKGVYNRAITLFKTIHVQEDEIFVVANENDLGDNATFKRKLNIFYRYVEDKSVLNKLKHTTLPYIFSEENEDGKYKTYRFILKCKTSDIKYILLLKAICNQDMGIKPRIFHDYDDRGCDLMATSTEIIRDVYDKYNDWILDYDRNEIDEVFK